MAKKNEEVKTIVWVFWIMLAIIGVGLLFAGIQSSVQGRQYYNICNVDSCWNNPTIYWISNGIRQSKHNNK